MLTSVAICFEKVGAETDNGLDSIAPASIYEDGVGASCVTTCPRGTFKVVEAGGATRCLECASSFPNSLACTVSGATACQSTAPFLFNGKCFSGACPDGSYAARE